MRRRSSLASLLAWLTFSSAALAQAPAGGSAGSPPSITWGDQKVSFGLDFSFAMIHDDATHASLGREQQMRPAFAIMSVYGDATPHLSFRVDVNPVNGDMAPRPYVPNPADRRTFFFPNQPDYPGARGFASDPEGLYRVDDYKNVGFDPILQAGALRTGYVDLHTASGRFGLRVGRFYVNQGLGVGDLVWFTSKDLTHIQRINFQTDNGVALHYDTGPLHLEGAAIAGAGNPYHDYAYFDLTDPSEDKNSSFGGVATIRATFGRSVVGASVRKNRVGSRIEDSITLQLSKQEDSAIVVFGSLQQTQFVRVFGEFARYTWGLAPTSAELLPGPPVKSPVPKSGYYAGVDLYAPRTRYGQVGVTVTREELSRDDALVAWAAARSLYGAALGKYERSTVIKVHGRLFDSLTVFFFYNMLSNPFPELSAIKPISGPGSDQIALNDKYGAGVRFTF